MGGLCELVMNNVAMKRFQKITRSFSRMYVLLAVRRHLLRSVIVDVSFVMRD